jgi:hypothetical protein
MWIRVYMVAFFLGGGLPAELGTVGLRCAAKGGVVELMGLA